MAWRFNITKMSMFPKMIYGTNLTPIKISYFFLEINELMINIMWESKELKKVGIIWSKKEKEDTIVDIKSYYKSTI